MVSIVVVYNNHSVFY